MKIKNQFIKLLLVSGVLMVIHNVIEAQNSNNEFIDTLLIEDFAKVNLIRNSLDYQVVWKESKKIFKKGKKVNRDHLESIFRKRYFPHLEINDEKNLTRYRLFNGSNGIIGKDIILTINSENEISKLEIIDFGR